MDLYGAGQQAAAGSFTAPSTPPLASLGGAGQAASAGRVLLLDPDAGAADEDVTVWVGGVQVPNVTRVRWVDDADDIGSGSLELLEPVAGFETLGSSTRAPLFVCKLGGETAFSWYGRKMRRRAVGVDNHTTQVWEGPGWLSYFDRFQVRPHGGPGRKPYGDARTFGWADPAYQDTYWTGAHVYLAQISRQIQVDPPFYEPWFTPPGFPAADHAWYWSTNRGTVFPSGRAFFRCTQSFAAGMWRFFLAGDGRVRLFIDGLEVLGWTEAVPVQSFLKCYAVELELTAGTHLVGVEAEVYDLSTIPGNTRPQRGMMACAWSPSSTSGDYDCSASSYPSVVWKAYDYPDPPERADDDPPPALNPAQVVQAIWDESAPHDLSWGSMVTFSSTYDSSGWPWPANAPVTFPIGESMLDVLRRMRDMGLCEFGSDPGGGRLHMWVPGRKGVVTGLNLGSQLQSLDVDREYPL